jgi:hypothetical protein
LYPSPHIRGGKEVKDRPAAPLIGEKVTDLEPIFSSTRLLPHFRPQDLLLGLPVGAILEKVLRVRHGHQHLAVGLLFVHLRYWPVRQ